MAKREVINAALDVGRHSFDDYLEERLAALKSDLVRECNRIAASRELKLRSVLNDTHRQNEELRAHLQTWPVNPALSLGKGQPHQTMSNNSELQPSEIVTDAEGQPDAYPEPVLVMNTETFNPISRPDGQDEKTSLFTLWGEWEDVEAAAHEGKQGLRDSDLEEDFEEELEWILNRESDRDCQTNRSRCTVNPNSQFAIGWEVLGIPILFYDLITIPMQVFFESEGIVFEVISWLLILYWTFDMILRLSVIGLAKDDGTVNLDRMAIAKTYLRRAFAFDFFMVAPDWFSKVVGAGGMRNVAVLRLFRILRLMRLMRMSKMKKIFRHLEDIIDSEYFTVGVSIFVNLFAIIGVCHYMGCFWFWMGTIKIRGQPSWVDKQFSEQVWTYQYVMSLHWAIAQFTPGASKIQPTNEVEAAAGILVLIFGLIFLSLFISALSHARSRLQSLAGKLDRDSWVLRRYLKQQGLSLELKVRTMRYVEKVLEPQMMRVQRKDVSLIPLLSRPLQLAVQEERFFHTLIAHPFLKSLRERSLSLTLHLFVDVIIEIQLADSDLLFDSGSIAHEMYFVSQGELAYLHHGNKQKYRIHQNSWCSELVLFVPWVHNGTAKAKVESHVISVDSAKMRTAVLEHKERNFVSRCAVGYLKDLNALVEKGEVISDVTRMSDDSSSFYVKAVLERPHLTPASNSSLELGEMGPAATENGDDTAAAAGTKTTWMQSI